VIGVGLCLALAALYWALRGGWLDAMLAGITLAMGILPQEFPVIMIVFLALGARRIAAQRVLTRRLNAIETLGETTVPVRGQDRDAHRKPHGRWRTVGRRSSA